MKNYKSKKIKWYHKIPCFILGHKDINKQNKNVTPVILPADHTHGIYISSDNLSSGDTKYTSDSRKDVYGEVIIKCCTRCGIYLESYMFTKIKLSKNEEMIKEIIS